MGIELSVWRIHRKIGMSGGLFANALLRETGLAVTQEDASRLRKLHGDAYARRNAQVRPLPGARELLQYLSVIRVPWAIATSGYSETAGPTLEPLGVPDGVPIITRDQVARAKPDPDLFLAAASRLGVDIEESIVVGDSVWDLLAARRARALGVGLLSGGYGRDELERADAYQGYDDPADLLDHLDEGGSASLRRRDRISLGWLYVCGIVGFIVNVLAVFFIFIGSWYPTGFPRLSEWNAWMVGISARSVITGIVIYAVSQRTRHGKTDEELLTQVAPAGGRRGRRVAAATENGGDPGWNRRRLLRYVVISKRCRSGRRPECSCGRRRSIGSV